MVVVAILKFLYKLFYELLILFSYKVDKSLLVLITTLGITLVCELISEEIIIPIYSVLSKVTTSIFSHLSLILN